MSLYEQAVKAYEQKKQNEPPCNSCIGLTQIGAAFFCKIKDKFLLPNFPPTKCEKQERKSLRADDKPSNYSIEINYCLMCGRRLNND